ncbi:Bifunctional adenosylcobalamin biosynthesis protein CobP [Geodia barretti]|uniref:Adenosylcobinamide kinase n=1 Tax=Geodia barretti TaxID=519541 RepID=A0AA35XC63_GEOBA|nr:Bifunctional adenosylcobalamin biosynthesis protein CobP [Geodia barretti]
MGGPDLHRDGGSLPGALRSAVLRGRHQRGAGRRERTATVRARGRRRGPPAGGAQRRRRQPADGRARRLAVRGDRAPAGAAVRQHGALLIGQLRTVHRHRVRRRLRGARPAERQEPPGVRAVSGELVLLLGGARSGKSAAAERLAQAGRRVLFIATAEALDEDMRRRIAAHRERRPSGWDTLEEPLDPAGRAGPIVSRYDTVVLDCLTPCGVSNLLLRHEDDPARRGGLLDLIERSAATWILISNEVGLGVVPVAARAAYRDALGRVNQLAAARRPRLPHGRRARPGAEGPEHGMPLTQLGR